MIVYKLAIVSITVMEWLSYVYAISICGAEAEQVVKGYKDNL